MTKPVNDQLTDREWSIRASNQAREVMAHVGDLNSRYNDLVDDNRTLLSEIDKLSAKIAALEEAVALLTTIVLDS